MKKGILYNKLLERKNNGEKLDILSLNSEDWHQLIFAEDVSMYDLSILFSLKEDEIKNKKKKYIKNIYSYIEIEGIFNFILKTKSYMFDASVYFLSELNKDYYIGKANHKKKIIYGLTDSGYYKELYNIQEELKKQEEISKYNLSNNIKKKTFMEIISDKLYYLLKNDLITIKDLRLEYEDEDFITPFISYMESTDNTYILDDIKEIKTINELEILKPNNENKPIKPRKRKGQVTSSKISYPRDNQIAVNALAFASYLCEIDKSHYVFKRRKNDTNYTEPHHLIPMEYQYKFENSLDVEANIISLCSNCHNEIHYGRNYKKLIEKLYNERKEKLELAGIYISLDELYKLY